MSNAHEVYVSAVKCLPPEERLQLATMILGDLCKHPTFMDARKNWDAVDHAEDIAEVRRSSSGVYRTEEDLG